LKTDAANIAGGAMRGTSDLQSVQTRLIPVINHSISLIVSPDAFAGA